VRTAADASGRVADAMALARLHGADAQTLQRLDHDALAAALQQEGLVAAPDADDSRLRAQLLLARSRRSGFGLAHGILEASPDGFGFLRSPAANLLPSPEDVYVRRSQIARLALRTGDRIFGLLRPPRSGEPFACLLQAQQVNGLDFEAWRRRRDSHAAHAVLPAAPLPLDAGSLLCPWLQAAVAMTPWRHGVRVALDSDADQERRLDLLLALLAAADGQADRWLCLFDADQATVRRMRAALPGVTILSANTTESEQARAVVELALAAARRATAAGRRTLLAVHTLAAVARVAGGGRPRPGAEDASPELLRRLLAAARQLECGGSLTLLLADPRADDAPLVHAGREWLHHAELRWRQRSDGAPCLQSLAARPELLPDDAETRRRWHACKAQLAAAQQAGLASELPRVLAQLAAARVG
jgi:transcription termination factor Rho